MSDLQRDFAFRRRLLLLLSTLRDTYKPIRGFDFFLQQLHQSVPRIPEPTMKDSRHFFLQATILLLKEHDKFIDVAHEDLTTNTQASDRFTLTLKSPLDARLKDIQSFSDNPKFLSGIQHTHVNLHKKLLSIPKGFRLHEHIQREFPYTFEFNRFRLNKNELFPVARGYEVGSFERYDYLADFRKQLDEMTSLFEWIEISYKEFSEQKELFLAQQEQLLLREKKLLEAHNDVIFYENLLSLNEKVTGHRFVLRLPEAKDYLLPGMLVELYTDQDLEDIQSYWVYPLHQGHKFATPEQTFQGLVRVTSLEQEPSSGVHTVLTVNEHIQVLTDHRWFEKSLLNEFLLYIEETPQVALENRQRITNSQCNELRNFLKKPSAFAAEVFFSREPMVEQLSLFSSPESSFNRNMIPEGFHTNYISVSEHLYSQHPVMAHRYAILADSLGLFTAVLKTDQGQTYTSTHKLLLDACLSLSIAKEDAKIITFAERNSSLSIDQLYHQQTPGGRR